LWDLDIDDLLKANQKDIGEVYNRFKKSGDQKNTFDMEDCCRMMRKIGFTGVENERKACFAYSLSKQYIINEMDDFDNYTDLKLYEFYELIGRIAHLMYSPENYGENYPLLKKI
jgi:hypothetical protein